MDNVPVHTATSNGRGNRNEGSTRRRLGFVGTLKAKTTAITVGVVLIVAILVFGALQFYNSTMGANIDSGKYQAVFFTNGQVYFGKLHILSGSYVKLTNVFYLQAKEVDTSKVQETSDKSNPSVELVKLGNEIHGPTDEMIINKDQILFFENLKADGKVGDSIAKYHQSGS